MFCTTGDRALGAKLHNTCFLEWARHTFYYRIAPPGNIGDLSEVGTAGIAAPNADDDGSIGANNSGIARRQRRLGTPGIPAIDPLSKWLWNKDG